MTRALVPECESSPHKHHQVSHVKPYDRNLAIPQVEEPLLGLCTQETLRVNTNQPIQEQTK